MPRSDLSYVHGASDSPLLGRTIGDVFDEAASRHGERLALVVRHQGIRWRYAELAREVERFAVGLLELGLAPGDRIGIWAPNCAEWVVTQFATAKAGLVLVNINPAYRGSELAYCLTKVGCKALIFAPRFKSSDYVAMLRELMPEIDGGGGEIASTRFPELRHLIVIAAEGFGVVTTFAAVAATGVDGADRLAEVQSRLEFDDAINIQFTSGTTGAPKGATLSHHNLINNGHFSAGRMHLGADDRLCIPVPLYHCFGMVLGNLACLTRGAAMVYPSDAFDPLALLQTIAEERCTAVHGVPTMFIAALDHPEFRRFDLSSLRTGIMAGAPCPIEVMSRCITDMHLRELTIVLGMTETSPASFQSATDTPLEARVATVGTVLPHVEAKIVDASGHIVARGEVGELLLRGYLVMQGYWDDAAQTAAAIDKAGWLRTGDLATIDAAGYCRIVGRLKDMIIRGGENISPREVEEFLYRHPKIREVQVIGVPDPRLGEEVCAWVRLGPGERLTTDELRSFCQGHIAHYKIPRYWRVVDQFPVTITGKIQKFRMREIMRDELCPTTNQEGFLR